MSICAHKEIKNGKIVRDFGKGYSEKTYLAEECLKDMLNEQGFMVSAWGKLYSKELFKNIRFPVGKLHEDIGTTYKLIMGSKKISYGPASKYLYSVPITIITFAELRAAKIYGSYSFPILSSNDIFEKKTL